MGDKHFMIVAIIGVIVLGALGLIGGTILIVYLQDAVAGAACIGLAGTAIGTLGGVLIAPKSPINLSDLILNATADAAQITKEK